MIVPSWDCPGIWQLNSDYPVPCCVPEFGCLFSRKFWACLVVPLSQDNEGTYVFLSRKVALSHPNGNLSLKSLQWLSKFIKSWEDISNFVALLQYLKFTKETQRRPISFLAKPFLQFSVWLRKASFFLGMYSKTQCSAMKVMGLWLEIKLSWKGNELIFVENK